MQHLTASSSCFFANIWSRLLPAKISTGLWKMNVLLLLLACVCQPFRMRWKLRCNLRWRNQDGDRWVNLSNCIWPDLSVWTHLYTQNSKRKYGRKRIEIQHKCNQKWHRQRATDLFSLLTESLEVDDDLRGELSFFFSFSSEPSAGWDTKQQTHTQMHTYFWLYHKW